MALPLPRATRTTPPIQPATIARPLISTQNPIPWRDLITQVRGVMDAFDTVERPQPTQPAPQERQTRR